MTPQYDPPVPVSAIAVVAALGGIALIGIVIYRRNESRTPHLQALVDGQVTLEMLPESIQRRLADPKHRAGPRRHAPQDGDGTPRRRRSGGRCRTRP